MIQPHSGLRAAFVALLMVLFMQPLLATAQVTDINSAINKAGRERMLSQRMAKAYFQLGQGIDTARSQRVLDASIALFDRQLVELKNYAPNAQTRETSLKLEKAWIAYKDVLVGAAPSRERAPEVLKLSDEVLGLAHQLTGQFEALSGTQAGRLVNISGRQRMLSQRMAKLHQALNWNLPAGTMREDLAAARKEFAAAMAELEAAPINTDKLKSDLKLASQQWFFFQNALDEKGQDTLTRATNVATTSERILEIMEAVVTGYEALH